MASKSLSKLDAYIIEIEYNWIFNNYSPKAKWLPVNIHRDEVEVNIHRNQWAWGE
jgi:hypothetical protein